METGWSVVLRNLKTGYLEIFIGEKMDEDWDSYAPDVHIVPSTLIPEHPGVSFRGHEFKRECYCHPGTQPCNDRMVFVVHQDIVN